MANLSADLPENWTEGQIISPNGTEVGLTEQHGYNYLMKQVNATQTEVNSIQTEVDDINTSLTGVAKETSVQNISAKVGLTTDTSASASTGTVMGKLNSLLTDSMTIDEVGQFKIFRTASPNEIKENFPIFSISGRGLLYGIHVENNTGRNTDVGDYTRVEVNIDSQQKANLTSTVATTGEISSVNFLIGVFDSFSTWQTLDYDIGGDSGNSLLTVSSLELPQVQSVSDNVISYKGAFEKPILFNAGLEINIWKTVAAGALSCRVVYKLLD